ncbi:unnamed protein product [Mytilus edulis]|uniref:Uncharacterized protein n=1 Tax=Mytilus edulis TaxID=6550 RepID=A0A8S3VS91_MYTED|nr:unnamed protein product [Mytilus edulis]
MNESDYESDEGDICIPKFKKESKWNPPKSKNDNLESFITSVKAEVRSSISGKQVRNISKSESQAMISLKDRDEIVIKQADKGSADVFMMSTIRTLLNVQNVVCGYIKNAVILQTKNLKKQSENTNLTYTCPLCENLEDIFINECFIQFELENYREGTNTPLNVTFNIEEEEEEEEECVHIDTNNSNQQQESESKSKTEVHVSYNQRDKQEQLVNDINQEETKVKTVGPDELNENSPTHVIDQPSHSPINLKPRPKKGKRKKL